MSEKSKAIQIGRAIRHAVLLGSHVADERARQVERFGVQRHPWVRRFGYGSHYETLAAHFKGECQRADKDDENTWDLIFLEEVYEALEELEKGDLAAAKDELIQVMAVAAAIVEHIDHEEESCRSTRPAPDHTAIPAGKLG